MNKISNLSPPLRVALLIDAWYPELGGGQVNAWEISSHVCQRQAVEVDIFTRDLWRADPQINAQPESPTTALRVFKLGPRGRLFNWWLRILWLFTVIGNVLVEHRRQPYQVIHCHVYAAIVPAKLLSWWLRLPLVITVHGVQQMETGQDSLLAPIETYLTTKVEADTVISVQHHFNDFDHKHKRVVVIPNGVDMSLYPKKKADKPEYFKLVWLGRFYHFKGLPILFNAVNDLSSRCPYLQLHLIGTGEHESELKRLVQDLQLTSRVIFEGVLTGRQKIKALRSSHVFVFPSLAEGQPIVLLEAGAAQLPIIATDVGDNDQLIKSKKQGWLIPANDVAALTEAIEAAYCLPKVKLEAMGQANYQLISRDYTWQAMADNTYQVYQSLVK